MAHILVRLDLPAGAVEEAQRLLRPLLDGGPRTSLSDALAHAVQYASGYRLYLADDGSEVPAPARAPMKTVAVCRSPFALGMAMDRSRQA
jgi:hypothetical protein